MSKQKIYLKVIVFISVFLTASISIVFSQDNQTNVVSGDCADGHDDQFITITTNYTGDSTTIEEGQSFDLEITATGQVTADGIGFAFWHTGSDGLEVPDTSPFITENIFVNQWTDASYYYAMFSWSTVVDPMTRTFRISSSTTGAAVETLVLQVAGDTDRRSNVISFQITIVPPPETNPPNVTITAPIDDSYVKGSSVSIDATVEDDSGVDSVWAEITNSTYNETVLLSGSEPNFSGTWDSTVVADGTYTLTVKANDTQLIPNVNDTESITIKVDNNAPNIAIDSIIPNPSNGITTITASNASADINGTGIWATISPPTGGDIYLDLNYQGSNIWNNTFTVTQNGAYSVSINATDLASNTAVIGPTIVTGDIINPSVTITYPAEGQLVGGSIAITGIASGTGTNIASITINDTTWGDGSQHPQIDTATGNPSGDFSFENKTFIVPKEYWVEINVTDLAGNINSTVRYFNVTSDDLSPPNMMISISADPSNGFTNITVIASEDLIGPPLLNITLPSSSVVYRPMFLIGTRTWRTNYTVISDGTHTININATDEALNTGYDTETFEGDITAPNITVYISPDPSNGPTTIYAYNITETVTSILANISKPGGGYLYETLSYQGSNEWTGTFNVTETGTYNVYLNCSDIAGNIGYNSSSMEGDVTGPGIFIVSITPNPSNGLTTITASNTTSDIDGNGIRANISTPSAGALYVILLYQGANQWTGTFTVTEDGTYSIWINATDTLGNPSIVGPQTINGDFSPPIILINSPSIGDTGANPPNFDITIIDYLVDTTWYSIYDGNKWSDNKTFTGTTGTIDNTIWDSISNGELIIRFYANDSFGNLGFNDTSIIKGTATDNGDGTDEPILIDGEQLLTMSIIIGLFVLGGLIVIMTDSEKNLRKR